MGEVAQLVVVDVPILLLGQILERTGFVLAHRRQ